MSREISCELVSWAGVQRLSRGLAGKIRADGFRPEVVVAIARGGYVPARLLCDHLDLADLTSIRIVHYAAGAQMQRKAELVEGLCRGLEGKPVLLVDDISDTGDTLALARDHLLCHGAGPLRIAVLHHKQVSTVVPDYYGHRIIKWRWITYPWALIEDVTGFIQRMPERPLDAAQAANRLLQAYGIEVPASVLEEVMAQLDS